MLTTNSFKTVCVSTHKLASLVCTGEAMFNHLFLSQPKCTKRCQTNSSELATRPGSLSANSYSQPQAQLSSNHYSAPAPAPRGCLRLGPVGHSPNSSARGLASTIARRRRTPPAAVGAAGRRRSRTPAPRSRLPASPPVSRPSARRCSPRTVRRHPRVSYFFNILYSANVYIFFSVATKGIATQCGFVTICFCFS